MLAEHRDHNEAGVMGAATRVLHVANTKAIAQAAGREQDAARA
jgi:hypothetical protein